MAQSLVNLPYGGKLGLAEIADPAVLLPRAVLSPGPAFARTVAGRYHTCATRTDGTLWCWGQNGIGQLGVGREAGKVSSRPLPVRRADGAPFGDVVDVSLGQGHTCAVTQDGALHCWGSNRFGQLGTGGHGDADRPVMVRAAPDDSPLSRIVQVRSGDNFTCALDTEGAVWCFGDNRFGQLGAGLHLEGSSRAVRVVSGPRGEPLRGAQQLANGSFSACALARDGTLWCWGRNNGAQLGLGDTRDRNIAVMARPPCP